MTAAALIQRGMRPVSELAATRPHGDRLRYMAGCRCDQCRRANTAYESMRQKARRAGDWNGIVSADRARAHLRKLSRLGIGRRTVEEATDLPNSILLEIKKGRKLRIRARTERLILGVGKAQLPDSAFVPAARTWRLIDKLIEEGYIKSFLAKRLGFKGCGLQFNRRIVTVRTAARVERLHRDLTA